MFAGSHFGMFAKNVVENNLAEPRAMKNEMMWGKISLQECKTSLLQLIDSKDPFHLQQKKGG